MHNGPSSMLDVMLRLSRPHSRTFPRPGSDTGALTTLTLAGVTTNFTATVAAYGKVLGKPVGYTQVPPEAAKQSMMGAGWPEWQVDGVLELLALVNEGDPSGLIPEADDNTLEVLGRPADSPEAFMENFKGMFG